jgi:hypothetical protein
VSEVKAVLTNIKEVYRRERAPASPLHRDDQRAVKLESCSELSETSEWEASENVTVFFPVMTDDYPIEKCSLGFCALTGWSPPSLLEWVLDKEGFIYGCQMAALNWQKQQSGCVSAQETMRISLRPPIVSKLIKEFRATVDLSLSHNCRDIDSEEWTVRATLSRITKVRRKSHHVLAGRTYAAHPILKPLGVGLRRRDARGGQNLS